METHSRKPLHRGQKKPDPTIDEAQAASRSRPIHHVHRPAGQGHARRNRANSSPSPRRPSSMQSGGDSDDDSSEYREPHPGKRFRQPLMRIDWRAQLCQFLNIGTESSDETILEFLEAAADKLEEAERLLAVETEQHDLVPRYQIIHRVNCSVDRSVYLYPERPFVVSSGRQGAHLRGTTEPIHNFDLYLERDKAISFIIYRDYRCCDGARASKRRNDRTWDIEPSALLTGESISIVSPILCSVMKAVTEDAVNSIGHPDFQRPGVEFSSPYLWWFFKRHEISLSEERLNLNEYALEHVEVFKQYLQDHLYGTWSVVDSLLGEGKISAQYIEYLFEPETIIVSNSENERPGQQQAYQAKSYLTTYSQDSRPTDFQGVIEAVHWTFDGTFQLSREMLIIDNLPSLDEPFPIRNLRYYPIKYAEGGLQDIIRDRGIMFWECRFRNYVCYSGPSIDGIQSNSDPRFMIDISTFQQMHPSTDPKKVSHVASDLELPAEEMSRKEPPPRDSFVLCLPKVIPGFDMNKKEWTSLDVSRLAPVKWNTEAFESLVIDEQTKELIKALVTNQIDAEKGTDLMSGKGNGLFILLHGGPGTGKTLTAESVAEVSKKPLYRVTCGDIGTKAEDVEKYLQVVMLLGKTWGCVVLLDEADVFLEKRKTSDLERNALVSVFLRVLEYYDGILILTSNRVGFFDEAFKSRIQLTLRYKTLDRAQRLQIWQNFFKRLKELQEEPHNSKPHSAFGGVDFGIDTKQLEGKIDELADVELNGREIRNVISTARQLAMFRKEKMGYQHLRVALDEAMKFEKYLLELREGFSADEIAKADGARF